MIGRAVLSKHITRDQLRSSESTPCLTSDTPSDKSLGTTPISRLDDSKGSENNEEDIETISCDHSIVQLPTIRREPHNPKMSVESIDMGYFSFFLQEMAHISSDFKDLFPTFICDSFAYSIDNNALRHSVLAASAMIVDKRQGNDMLRFHRHRQQTYSGVRQQLASGEYDTPLAAAIFWTQYIDLIYGDFDAAAKHNNGLYLVLRHFLDYQGALRQGGTRPNITTLCMILWRLEILSDIVMSHGMNGKKLSFPPIRRDQEHFHRGWMEDYTRASITEDAVEWATASFSLECFLHRACHIANDFIKFRVNGEFPPEIATKFERVKQSLIVEHLKWLERPIIQKALSEELVSATLAPMDEPNHKPFLNYPPIPPIKNSLFAWLRNLWYANYIYISILNYKPDRPRPHDPRRIECAVEICRVYASTGFGNFPGFSQFSVIMAAVAFAESPIYEKESNWIYNQMNMHNGAGKLWVVIPKCFGRMGELWGKQYFEWEDVFPEYCVVEES